MFRCYLEIENQHIQKLTMKEKFPWMHNYMYKDIFLKKSKCMFLKLNLKIFIHIFKLL